MPDNDQERSEKATPKRREDARKKGQVPTSRDLSSAALILVVVLIFKSFGGHLFSSLKETMVQSLSSLSVAEFSEATFTTLLQNGMISILYLLAPILGMLALVSIVSVVLQHGLLWTTEPIMPQFSRMSPLAGFKRIFSIGAFVNLGKTVLKFTIIGFVSYLVVRAELPSIMALSRFEGDFLAGIGEKVGRLILWSGGVVMVIGAADFGYQWWENERKLRMTRQEIKDELKQSEGTPLVRSRIRSLQRDMARKRMMKAVPKADVVVTNPTHLAVALMYRPAEMGAPRVVAKGAGFVAEKIREIAREHGIPIVEDKPVAQTLFKTVEIGGEIPANIYRAVAEILAYVYKLRKNRSSPS